MNRVNTSLLRIDGLATTGHTVFPQDQILSRPDKAFNLRRVMPASVTIYNMKPEVNSIELSHFSY